MVMIRYSFPDRGRGQDKRISININIKPLWKCGEFSVWSNQVSKMMYTYKSAIEIIPQKSDYCLKFS